MAGIGAYRIPCPAFAPAVLSQGVPVADQPTLPESAAVEEPTVPVKVESTAADRKQKPDASDATPAPAEERACEEAPLRSAEHTSELQSRVDLVCRLLLE